MVNNRGHFATIKENIENIGRNTVNNRRFLVNISGNIGNIRRNLVVLAGNIVNMKQNTYILYWLQYNVDLSPTNARESCCM